MTYLHNSTCSIAFIMQSLKSHSNFFLEKECFKRKDSEAKEERRAMEFQTEVNLICMFSHVILMCVFIYIIAVNYIHLRICSYPLFLSMTLFVYHFLPPCELSEGIVYLSAWGSYFAYPSTSASLTFQLHWQISLWQGKPCSFCDW